MRIINNKYRAIGYGFASAFYVCLVIFIGYSAARQGLSSYYSDDALGSGSETDAAAAVSYLPKDPHAHKTRGEILLRNKDHASAADAYEQALALKPNDFLLWLRLGHSRSLLSDFDAATVAYRRALDLAPNYSQTNYDMGMMLLEIGQTDEAFRYLSKAAERDPELYPQVLDLTRISFHNDPSAIEKALDPATREAKMMTASFFVEHDLMTESVRSFLTGEELSESEKNEFVQYLLEKRNFQIAREVWLSKSELGKFDLNEPIFDGGFERITESDRSGFGWQINQNLTATAVTRDQETFYSGSSSLKVKFAGNVELGQDIVSQLAYVQPWRKYSLRVFTRSSELVSAGLPAIAVYDGVSKEMLGRSDELKANDDRWVQHKCEFVTRYGPVVRISLQRIKCETSPCPIFGELFLDDFRLSELGEASK